MPAEPSPFPTQANAPRQMTPVTAPVTGTIQPPGSKSITNRALIIAALAEGQTKLTGVLDSQDTRVMLASLQRLGIEWTIDEARQNVTITGCGGTIPAHGADLWLENSGTSIRFLTALCSLGRGAFRLDGNQRMRERPISDLVTALTRLGVDIVCETGSDCPPVAIKAAGLPGGTVELAGNLSSQYLSGLLMVAPYAQSSLEIVITGQLVSVPYVEMTLEVMKSFGVDVQTTDLQRYRIEPQVYRACEYAIEPDASAASYFFAAAAITGGTITVPGLHRRSLQGDVHFVDTLEEMGCRVDWQPDSITVTGQPLQGFNIDMNAISDTAQTLAAVALFANGPTRVSNVEHMRIKETDRVYAVVTELRRLGIQTEEHPDGFTIYPGPIHAATIETYDDHRMAMSFSLVGLKIPGISIANPGCTAKTYPNFFDDLDQLCADSHR